MRPGDLREVRELHLDAAVQHGQQKMRVSSQPIQLSDNEHSLGAARMVQGTAKFDAIISLAGFCFLIGGDWLHVRAKMAGNSFSLRSKSESTPALPAGRNTVVRDCFHDLTFCQSSV